MTTRAFIGSAGTGKTTTLLREVEQFVAGHPLGEGQRLLALTFMHGSRIRLQDRFDRSSVRRNADCETFDRFAWELCLKWRSRLRLSGLATPFDRIVPDYDATCGCAGELLKSEDVVKWITVRYPVILIDEFQDCAPVRLTIAKRLYGYAALFLAADDFQNLSLTSKSPAVAWLESIGVTEELSVCHRTELQEIVSAAEAVRKGAPVVDGRAFRLIGAPAPSVAASFVSQTIGSHPFGNVVIISASRPESSPWVRQISALVSEKRYGRQQAGPFSIRWEKTVETITHESLLSLGLNETDSKIVSASEIKALDRCPVATHLALWAEHQRRVLGRTAFPSDEIRAQINKFAQQVRLTATRARSGIMAMTIHQAKNREFPVVLVLWPFVRSDPIAARRLLYNAITRAVKRVVIIVQDPKGVRTKAAPFA